MRIYTKYLVIALDKPMYAHNFAKKPSYKEGCYSHVGDAETKEEAMEIAKAYLEKYPELHLACTILETEIIRLK